MTPTTPTTPILDAIVQATEPAATTTTTTEPAATATATIPEPEPEPTPEPAAPAPAAKPITLSLEVIGSAKPWVARITGTSARYGLDRQFLCGIRDYSNANRARTRGVMVRYALTLGEVYEVNSPETWARTLRYFVTGGGQRMEPAQVHAFVRAREQAEQAAKAQATSAPAPAPATSDPAPAPEPTAPPQAPVDVDELPWPDDADVPPEEVDQ